MESLLTSLLLQEDEELSEDEEDFQRIASTGLILAVGIEESSQVKSDRRANRRTYLTLPELLSHCILIM